MKKLFLYISILLVLVFIIFFIVYLISLDVPEIELPEGYIEVEDTYPFLFKAWSPNNCVIGITEHNNEKEAPLDVIVEGIEKYITLIRKYDLVEIIDFKPEVSGEGKCLIFEMKSLKVSYLLFVGIARTDSTIYKIEAAGEKEFMEEDRDKILEAFNTLD